jgi:Tol biopolymer transport system component
MARNHLVSALSAAALSAVLLAMVAAPQAEAAFPGANGNIVFQREGDIWLISSSSAPFVRTNLTPDTASSQEVDPSISPDGTKVAFVSDRDGDFEVFTLDIYAGTLTRVTNNSVRDAEPAWSPDGARLAYESPTSTPGRTDTDVWIRNADGTGTATDITSISGVDDRTPSWSPDGGEVAYAISTSVLVKNLSTGANRTIFSTCVNAAKPNWSPDGARIVFQANGLGCTRSDYEILTARSSDGGDVQALTNNSLEDGDAAYSPDGTRIAFIRDELGAYDIFTMDANGANQRGFFGDGSPSEVSPDWGVFVPPPAGCTAGGTFFTDYLRGTTGNDALCSLAGNDEVDGFFGDDTLKGGSGADTLTGGLDRDSLLGGGARDTLNSQDGVNRNDRLNGGPGRDRCIKDPREVSVRSCP